MKNILIIGGKTGVGRAVIETMVHAGHQVHVAARPPLELDTVGLASVQVYDALTPSVLNLPEVLDGIVYCPGSIQLKPFHRLSQSDLQQDYQVNAGGAVNVLQQAMPALKRSAAASVVFFSTVAVQTGMPFHVSIAMAKGALEGLTRSLAAELAPKIRVNAIAPSLTDTPLAETLLNSDAKRDAAAQRHPLKSIGAPSDTAALVSYLLGDESKFMSGQVLHLDGGLSSLVRL